MDICESCGQKTKPQKKKRGGLAPSLQTTEPATQKHSTIPAKNKQRRGTKAANKREVLRLLNWQVLPTYLLVPLFFFLLMPGKLISWETSNNKKQQELATQSSS